MAKHVLNTSARDLDFILIGIASAENTYGIVTRINETLNIDLVLGDNIPYNLKDDKLFYFSLFTYVNDELGLEYFLIPNTSNLELTNNDGAGGDDLFGKLGVEESTKLVKELPKTNYFLILKGEELHLYQFKIMELLKTINEVIQVQSIEPNDLPSRMNLVF